MLAGWIRAVQLLASSLLIATAGAVQAQTPAPVLRVNSPFAAPLWRIAVDRDETRLVSSSSYRAVSVWSLINFNAPRILRVPLRDEQRRRAHGIAITPDGATIAYGVPPLAEPNGTPILGTGRIYILREADGAIIATIQSGIRTRTQALAFSPDGRYLAAVLSSGCGLRVWNTTGWELVTSDDEGYAAAGGDPAEGCGGPQDTTGIAFAGTADAPVLITAGDTGLRSYTLDGGRFIRQRAVLPAAISLERPEGVVVSPDGRSIAVGDRRLRGAEQSDAPVVMRVAVLSVETLAPLRRPYELSMDSRALAFPAYLDPNQVPDARLFSLSRVAWVAEGREQWIYAGGFFPCEAARPDLRARPAASRQEVCLARWSATRPDEEPMFIPHGTDRLMDLAPLAKTGALAVASQKAVSVMSLRGEPMQRDGRPMVEENAAVDFRDGARTFSISSEGDRVLFETYTSGPGASDRLMFDATKLAIARQPQDAEAPLRPNQDPNILGEPNSRDPRRSRWWRNTEGPPRFLRAPLEDRRLDKDDIYRSVALNLEKRLAVVGSSNFLRVIGIGEDRPKILCELPIAEEAYRVNITPDAAIVVAGHSDGVLRWYRNTSNGDGCRLSLVLSALITRTPSGEWTWIAWVPSGEFANDPAALDLLSWQVSEAAPAVKTVGFSRLLEWYKQDKVAGAIAAVRASPAEPSAQMLAADQQKVASVASRQILTVVSKLERTRAERFVYRVNVAAAPQWPKTLTVRTGDGQPVLIAPVAAEVGAEQPPAKPELSLAGPGLVEMSLVLPAAARRAAAPFGLCFFLDGERQDECRALRWEGPVEPTPSRRLWAVIVGFSRYDAREMQLKYAQNDALDLAKSFIGDFRSRGEGKQPVNAQDFQAISIDLALQTTDPALDQEAQELFKLPYVRMRSPSRDGIIEALRELAKRGQSQGEDLSGDLFVFYFSGHGFANPFARDRGLTALATPATRDLSEDSVRRTTVTSDDLISLIEQIPAQRLVIIDACRNAPATSRQRPFQTGALTQEFQERSLTTSYFFSARDGETSVEQADYVFDAKRNKPLQGNGLFTYGLLTALHSPSTDLPGAMETRNQLDAEEIFRFLSGQVFDLSNPDSIAAHLKAGRAGSFAQTPLYSFARPDIRMWVPRHVVLRTTQ